MTTALLHRSPPPPMKVSPSVPRLHNGDSLTQVEFHHRYEWMPEDVKAELIGGIVYMASPTRMPHGRFHLRLGAVLFPYEAATPGVEAATEATVILGDDSEPEPDLHLRLLPAYGGRSREDDDQYLVGPPELIIEVAHSSEAIDLHAKRADYERAGVLEYVVLLVRERGLRAFDVAAGTVREVDAAGVYRSTVFPGLWIDVAAIFSGDAGQVLRVSAKGLKSPEHAAFVKRIRATVRTGGPPKPTRRRRK